MPAQFPPSNPTTATQQATPFDSILTQCRDLVSERLNLALSGMLDKVDDALSALINETRDANAQKLYSQTRDKALAQRETIEKQFRARYLREFQQRSNKVRKIGESFAEIDLSSLELELVGEEDLDETLKFNALAGRLRQYCDEELIALDQRVGVLLGDANLQAEDNPFTPQAICDAYKDTCRQLDSNVEIRMVLLRLFDDHVVDEIRAVYKAVNALLVQNSILPKIRISARKEGSKPPAPVAREAEAPKAAAQPEPKAPEGDQDLFSILKNLRANNPVAMPQAGAGAGAGQGTPVAGPAGPATGGMHTVLQGPELLGLLTRIQLGDTSAVPGNVLPMAHPGGEPGMANVLHGLKGSSVGAGMNQLDMLTLDIMSMVFDQLFDEPKIPIGVKGLIGRLQIPMLKVAIADKTFFSKRAHPARRLLDTLGEISLRLPADFNASSPLFGRMEVILQELIDGFESNMEVFDAARGRLEALIAEEDKRVEQETLSEANRIEQGERLALAKTVAQAEIKARSRISNIPGPVLEFLIQQWVQVLLVVHVVDGEGSDPWKSALETMDLLIWSVEPKQSVDERRELAAIVPEVLQRISAGLRMVDIEDAVRKDFFTDLRELHTGIIDKPEADDAAATQGASGANDAGISGSASAVRPESASAEAAPAAAAKTETAPAAELPAVPVAEPVPVSAAKPESVPDLEIAFVPATQVAAAVAAKTDSVPAAQIPVAPVVEPAPTPAARPESVPELEFAPAPVVRAEPVVAAKSDSAPAAKVPVVPAVEPAPAPAAKPASVPELEFAPVPAAQTEAAAAAKATSAPAAETPFLLDLELTPEPAAPSTPAPAAKPASVPDLEFAPVPAAQAEPVAAAKSTSAPAAETPFLLDLELTPEPVAKPASVPDLEFAPTAAAKTAPAPAAQTASLPAVEPAFRLDLELTPAPEAQPAPLPGLNFSLEPAAKTTAPSVQPASAPVAKPAAPTAQPAPSAKPTAAPTTQPAPAQAARPTTAPTAQPAPVAKQTAAQPASAPAVKPAATPTAQPAPAPTAKPTVAPSAQPAPASVAKPTAAPTGQPAAAKPAIGPAALHASADAATPAAARPGAPAAQRVAPPIAAKPAAGPAAQAMPASAAKPTAAPNVRPASATPAARPGVAPTARPVSTPPAKSAPAPGQGVRPGATSPAAMQSRAEPKASVSLDFTAPVTVQNPFGGGKVEVEDLDFTAKPAAGAKRDAIPAELPANLAVGTWVGIRETDKKEPRRSAKLSFISPLKTRYLFVDGQGKTTLDCSRADLARRFQTGEVVIMDKVPEVPLFDRITEGLVGKLGGGKPPR